MTAISRVNGLGTGFLDFTGSGTSKKRGFHLGGRFLQGPVLVNGPKKLKFARGSFGGLGTGFLDFTGSGTSKKRGFHPGGPFLAGSGTSKRPEKAKICSGFVPVQHPCILIVHIIHIDLYRARVFKLDVY